MSKLRPVAVWLFPLLVATDAGCCFAVPVRPPRGGLGASDRSRIETRGGRAQAALVWSVGSVRTSHRAHGRGGGREMSPAHAHWHHGGDGNVESLPGEGVLVCRGRLHSGLREQSPSERMTHAETLGGVGAIVARRGTLHSHGREMLHVQLARPGPCHLHGCGSLHGVLSGCGRAVGETRRESRDRLTRGPNTLVRRLVVRAPEFCWRIAPDAPALGRTWPSPARTPARNGPNLPQIGRTRPEFGAETAPR